MKYLPFITLVILRYHFGDFIPWYIWFLAITAGGLDVQRYIWLLAITAGGLDVQKKSITIRTTNLTEAQEAVDNFAKSLGLKS
jgi:hypothetical protein